MTIKMTASKIEKLINEHLKIGNEMTGDEASELLKLFFIKYMNVAIPYVLGLLAEHRQQDAEIFVQGEIDLFANTLRGNVIIDAELQNLEHPWQELSHNQKVAREIMSEITKEPK